MLHSGYEQPLQTGKGTVNFAEEIRNSLGQAAANWSEDKPVMQGRGASQAEEWVWEKARHPKRTSLPRQATQLRGARLGRAREMGRRWPGLVQLSRDLCGLPVTASVGPTPEARGTEMTEPWPIHQGPSSLVEEKDKENLEF